MDWKAIRVRGRREGDERIDKYNSRGEGYVLI
jgi:hypothetical protein